jgi:hypothetical protein
MKLKNYKEWLVENGNAQMGITTIDNPGGFTYNPLGEDDDDKESPSNYMFFSNLKRIQDIAKMILEMDQEKIDGMLNNGHDWANDHITVAKENLSHVFDFLKSESIVRNESIVITEILDEAHNTTDLHRRYSMTPTWWAAWRDQSEKKKGYKIEKDAFAKTYEVKDKEGKVIMVFDYARNIVFTNHTPDQFSLDDEMSSKDMADVKDKAEKIKDDLAGVDPNAKKEAPPAKKEAPAEEE